MKETISTDLTNIALSQGIGKSQKATLDWFAMQHEEWLLVLDNADDLTLNLCPYLPHCSYGNILITSRNHDTCFYALQSCQVSDMRPGHAKDLLFKTTHLEQTNDTEVLATRIVKVYVFCLSSRSMQNYHAGTRTPCTCCGASWCVHLQAEVWKQAYGQIQGCLSRHRPS